jgi:alpha-galactosidase
MNARFPLGVVLATSLLPRLAPAAEEAVPTPQRDRLFARTEDSTARDSWLERGLMDPASASTPFSFIYDKQRSTDLLGPWSRKSRTVRLDDARTQLVTLWSDKKTGLEVECVAVKYADVPAVEWVVYVKNTGDKDTPILEDLCALDTRLVQADSPNFVVHHIRGSNASLNDFEPITNTVPSAGQLKVFSHGAPATNESASGNPSEEAMPMFNLDCGGRGIVAGLGWSGPWTATFERDGDREVRVRAKMDSTHLILRPGERIRSPLVLILFWKGDRIDAQNLWRRLILAHYSPRPGGKPFTGLTCDANWSNIMDTERHIQEINWWRDHDIPMECYWMDAAWTDMSKGWVAHQSHQTPNKKLFPKGMRPISDAAHKRDMKYLLWFVPHSMHAEVGIGKEHPEFLGYAFTHNNFPGRKLYGLDHGNPELNRYAIDRFSKIIADFGIDVFRQDGTAAWPPDSGPDRVGISQIRYMEGFYEFWDGLLKNNPNLLIDNCATGARRVELETMKRSIALHRSDLPLNPNYAVSVQAFNQGMFPWVPLHGGLVVLSQLSPYTFRSAYCPALLVGFPDEGLPPSVWITDVAKRWSTVDLDLLRRLMKEYRAVRPYVFGDYYPLTPYSRDLNVWVGWQFDRPDLGEGMVQMFRRPNSNDGSRRVRLHGLEIGATYTVVNLDIVGGSTMTGRQLMDDGLVVAIEERPGSALITYKKNS